MPEITEAQRECNRRYNEKHPLEKKEYNRKYHQEHREEIFQREKIYGVSYRLKLRIEVLTHYGRNKCSCIRCGFSDLRALTIDHINSDGVEHRRRLPVHTIYLWLRKNNYPEGFQTLCMNCQWIKRLEKKEF